MFFKRKPFFDGDPRFLYLGSKEGPVLENSCTPDYYEIQKEKMLIGFIKDFHLSKDIVIFCGNNANPNSMLVRLTRPFDDRQVDLERLFSLLGLGSIEFSSVFEPIWEENAIRKKARTKKNAAYRFRPQGKQYLSSILKKNIVYYEEPSGDHLNYEPEKYSHNVL